MSYATDGKCHNAEPGTYGHECGKPAAWLGLTRSGFRSGFCDDCKRNGYEARQLTDWQPIAPDYRPDAFITGWHHGSISQQHCSPREAEERFPTWDRGQIEAYLNGRDDGVAGDATRLQMMRAKALCHKSA